MGREHIPTHIAEAQKKIAENFKIDGTCAEFPKEGAPREVSLALFTVKPSVKHGNHEPHYRNFFDIGMDYVSFCDEDFKKEKDGTYSGRIYELLKDYVESGKSGKIRLNILLCARSGGISIMHLHEFIKENFKDVHIFVIDNALSGATAFSLAFAKENITVVKIKSPEGPCFGSYDFQSDYLFESGNSARRYPLEKIILADDDCFGIKRELEGIGHKALIKDGPGRKQYKKEVWELLHSDDGKKPDFEKKIDGIC